jgi:hypothetical protein
MYNLRLVSITFFFTLIPVGTFAQNDLMDLLKDSTAKEINYATATFKSTRILNGHSVERMPPGQLDVRISHRFGPINSGAYEFFGLDQFLNVRLGMEYGILNWLMVGVGREYNEKTYDGFAKFTVLRQSTGVKVMPVSLSVFTSLALKTLKPYSDTIPNDFSARSSYTGQILIARKISKSLSLQLMPSFVHHNYTFGEIDSYDLWAIGAGGRIKISKRISLNAEYYYVANKNNLASSIYDPFTVGFDIETGGHVFQLMFTNSYGIIEKEFLGETIDKWSSGDIHFGFNISRVFNLKKQKTPALSY